VEFTVLLVSLKGDINIWENFVSNIRG